ncbi:HCL314Wp [Eremothecium sinecaudum]|uniref:HCL314Wp n=1 Tax=Eremothecium sinecaudum TaxID=45286 RepID=A0A109UZ58_9SACH|nr:HCL314Wp [Eremothecium sinecaudum]AMD19837.1 HCL314Wp [Eremothecium sinecaudum]
MTVRRSKDFFSTLLKVPVTTRINDAFLLDSILSGYRPLIAPRKLNPLFNRKISSYDNSRNKVNNKSKGRNDSKGGSSIPGRN